MVEYLVVVSVLSKDRNKETIKQTNIHFCTFDIHCSILMFTKYYISLLKMSRQILKYPYIPFYTYMCLCMCVCVCVCVCKCVCVSVYVATT